MKYISIGLFLLFISCSTTKFDKQIINDFMTQKLASERYKNYKNLQILLFSNAGSRANSLSAYEYSFKEKNWTPGIKEWILDSTQINTIKEKKKNKKLYFWNKADFSPLNIEMITQEKYMRNIKSELYTNNRKLVLFITKPLIIDKNNAMLFFDSSVVDIIPFDIEHYTVLLKKQNNKWVIDTYFFDGNIN